MERQRGPSLSLIDLTDEEVASVVEDLGSIATVPVSAAVAVPGFPNLLRADPPGVLEANSMFDELTYEDMSTRARGVSPVSSAPVGFTDFALGCPTCSHADPAGSAMGGVTSAFAVSTCKETGSSTTDDLCTPTTSLGAPSTNNVKVFSARFRRLRHRR